MKHKEQEQLFKSWMANHQGLVYKVVRSFASSPQDQEDLFQDIAAQLWFSIPKFKGNSAETTWIYRVSFFCSMSWTKKEKRRREGRGAYKSEVSFLTVTPEQENPRLAWLYEQINKLESVERSLTLLLLDGYSYKEMASILGLTESNVGVKIIRIKKYLTEQSSQLEEVENGI
jgi:RNA polymerase sigma-70 factor (ECF subfamily)